MRLDKGIMGRRGRLIRHYFLISVLLIGGGLITSGLVELYFRYQESWVHVARLQHEITAGAAFKITEEAEARLTAYHWPGNVRELANVIERAVVLGQGPEVSLRDLPPRIAGGEREGVSDSLSYRRALDAARREVITRALAHTQGNRAAAARLLGLHKTHLLNLMKSLGIE